MKAGKVVKSLGMAAVALTLVSACMVGSTLAKYTSEVTGNGTAVVAKWAPTFNGIAGTDGQSFEVNLSDSTITDNTKLATGKIAPGTKGSFAIEVGQGGAEVAFDYTVAISAITNMPKNLKFYSAEKCEPSDELNFDSVSGICQLASGNVKVGGTVEPTTVYWKWAADGSDADDTADGVKAAADASFTITCTATQIDLAPAPAA